MSQLIIENKIANDEWTRVVPPVYGDEPVRKQAGKIVMFKLLGEDTFTQRQIEGTVIPTTGKILVPFVIWQTNKDQLASRMAAGEVAILFSTHEVIEDFAAAFPEINNLPMIAVYVEKFADGRNFTIGRLLRDRYGFKNELRAVGDVMRDQLFFLKQSGFNSYEIKDGRDAEAAIASLSDFSEPYQGSSAQPEPIFRRVSR